jgi:hypothetical protein
MKPTLAIIASLSASLLLSAGVGSAAAASSPVVRIGVQPASGLTLSAPEFRQAAEGIEIHGDVCRAPSRAIAGRVEIHVLRFDASGRPVGDAVTALAGALGPRDRACAPYTVRTAWKVGPDEDIRVCADRQGHPVCAVRGAGD